MTRTATTPVSEPLGDPLPAVLAAYYDAIDGDRYEAAAATFGPDGLHAVAVPEVVETGPRTETFGPAALLERLVNRCPQPWHHVPSLCVVDGPDALVEGTLVADTGVATSTFVGSARTSGDGLLERYLAFSCAGVRDAVPTDVGAATVPTDAALAVRECFSALDAGRFAEAASHFSKDVLYSHPPYKHTGIDDPDRIEFRGRAALQAAFKARGRANFVHTVLTSIQRGPHCMFEGAVNNLPDGGRQLHLEPVAGRRRDDPAVRQLLL